MPVLQSRVWQSFVIHTHDAPIYASHAHSRLTTARLHLATASRFLSVDFAGAPNTVCDCSRWLIMTLAFLLCLPLLGLASLSICILLPFASSCSGFDCSLLPLHATILPFFGAYTLHCIGVGNLSCLTQLSPCRAHLRDA